MSATPENLWGITTCTCLDANDVRCAQPAPWHMLEFARTGDTYLACSDHFLQYVSEAVDWHMRGPDCNMPGTRWRGNLNRPGGGHCYFPHEHHEHEHESQHQPQPAHA